MKRGVVIVVTLVFLVALARTPLAQGLEGLFSELETNKTATNNTAESAPTQQKTTETDLQLNAKLDSMLNDLFDDMWSDLKDPVEKIEIRDAKGEEVAAVQIKGSKGFRLTPIGHAIKEIRIDGASNAKKATLRIDMPPAGGAVQTYAFDPTTLDFTNGTIKVEAKGKHLYKCKNWSFDEQDCKANWEKIKELTPGEEYYLNITPDDPAFAEINTLNCIAEQFGTQGSWGSLCDGTYPANCTNGDLLSCDDGNIESHWNGFNRYAGIKVQPTHQNITDCKNITEVQLCYEWWGTATMSNCDISIDNDGDGSWQIATATCPETTANPGAICVNVTSLEDWTCEDFGNESNVTIKSEALLPGLQVGSMNWDLLKFNITYETIGPEIKPDIEPEIEQINATTIRANVTSFDPVDNVTVNITMPNGEQTNISLDKITSTTFEEIFSRLNLRGQYRVKFFAKDRKGRSSEKEAVFKRISPKIIDLVDRNNKRLDYDAGLQANSSGILDVLTQIRNHTIKEITVQDHDEQSPYSTIKIDYPNISNSVQSYAIDPTGLNFTTGTLKATAAGTVLYKCPTWNFTTNTCQKVELCPDPKNVTGCTTTGGWIKVMSLVPGMNYTVNFTAIDPAYAEYDATIGAPYCPTGESPCYANTSLLLSRDSLATPEPNQPNTVDACTDGASGTYLTDESVENITVESLNGTYFRQGDTVRVNASFLCWSTVNDNLNWVYTSNITTPSWSVKAFTDPCPTARPAFYQGSHSFQLDNVIGDHAVRIINQYNGNTATTCGGGSYDDNDDVAFRVYSRDPPDVTDVLPAENTTYDVNETVTISAKIEDDEGIREAQANVTLPDGTSVLLNMSAKPVGEVQSNITINSTWKTINFVNTYTEPVVFASPLALRDTRPAEVRIRNVGTTSFQIRAQQPTGDYPEPDNSSNEWPTSIFVMEVGTHVLSGGQQVEVHKNYTTASVSGTGPDTWADYTYNLTYSSTPMILSQVQTENSARFVTTTKRNVNSTNFQMAMEVAQDNSSAHPAETIGWLAARTTGATGSTVISGIKASTVVSSNTIRGYDNGCYAAAHGLGQVPSAVVGMQMTRNGGNGGWARYCSQTSTWTSANTYWTIDEVDNGERGHVQETVAFIAFNQSGTVRDSRYWSVDYNGTSQRGRYNATIIATDTPGNVNDTEGTTFIVPTLPNVTLVSPPNGTSTQNSSNTYVCNATDEFGLQNITLYIWNATGALKVTSTDTVSGKSNQSSFLIDLSVYGDGTYYWNCEGNTIYNATAFAENNYTLTIDTVGPNVTIFEPANGTTYNTTINLPLNFTAINTIAVDDCWYVLNGGSQTGLPDCNITNINVSAGQNNLTVFANDTAGNTGNDSVTFYALYATTLSINETADPVENGESFYYYADYEYESNGSDVLGATCTVTQLNDTEITYWSTPVDAIDASRAPGHYAGITFDNACANYICTNYRILLYLGYNGSLTNNSLRVWITNNRETWNNSITPDYQVNFTTHPQLNSSLQNIWINASDALFPTPGNYTIFLNCPTCNATENFIIGEDTDEFGHSFEREGPTGYINWTNFTQRPYEYFASLYITTKNVTMTYNSTNSRYESPGRSYFYKGTSITYDWQVNCNKTNHENQTRTSNLTVSNNYAPVPNITSVLPNPALFGVNNVTVTWNNDITGKAFGITSAYVNLTYPNGTFAAQYQGASFIIPTSILNVIGTYNLTAYAENSVGSGINTSSFQVVYPAPNVTIIEPLGESYANYRPVTIAANVTSANGIDKVIANITNPLGSKSQIELTTPIKSDQFDNSSQWQNKSWHEPPGTNCILEIDGSVPGKMRIRVNETNQQEIVKCGYYSKKPIYGDFNITVDYELQLENSGTQIAIKVTEHKSKGLTNSIGFQRFEGETGQGEYRASKTFNSTTTILSSLQTNDNNATLGISRAGNNFTLYVKNASGTYRVTSDIVNLTQGLHISLFTVTIDDKRDILLDNFTSSCNNAYLANFESTATNGTYNVTIIANNTYGQINDSEKTNFSIFYQNTRPTAPVIIIPLNDNTYYGVYNITWHPVEDYENDTLQFNISLLYPNGTFYKNIITDLPNIPLERDYYEWNSTLTPNGKYRMRITVFENATPQKLSNTFTRNGTFILNQEAPEVKINSPLGENYDQNSEVPLSANITDPDGIDVAYATIDSPNGSSYNVTLTTGFPGDTFDTDTLGTIWQNITTIGTAQTCIRNINQTVPGSGFANLSGSTLPRTFTVCGLGSEEIVDGDFDINVTWKLESSKWNPDGAVGMSLAEKQEGSVANKQIFIWYGNFTSSGRVIEVYANDNGTLTRITQIPVNLTNSTVRVVRRGNNFTFYDLNESGGNWVQLPITRNNWNLSRALHVHVAAVASYPFHDSIAVSVDQISVKKNTTYSGLFNHSSQLGNYNVTIHANDTLERRNDSETTNFTIVYINDGPSTPYILTPNVGEIVGGVYNITWLPVTDEEGHTLQYNITLLNATGGFVTQIASGLGPSNLTIYSWDTSVHSDGQYRLRVVVYENNTPEKLSNSYTMLGPFTITNVLPNVTIIAPQGETYDANKSVIISVNASSPVGIQSVIAQVDTPNGSSYNITLETGQQSDDFSTDTINISWEKSENIAGGQTCTVNINGTYPGKGYANISGNGFPNTFSTCGVGSEKRIDGDFKINLTWNWESPTQPVDGGVIFTLSEEKTASFSNRQVVIAYGNYSGGVGTATRIYANDNGTMEVITQIPKTIQNSTVKINRTGNNFTFYSCIVGGACQQIPVTRSILNLSRALYLQMGAYSTYPSYPQIAITVDEVNIKSDNLTFGGFNRTEQEGLHNVTIIATDTAGGINNTETTTFNITQINDPPSVPYLLAPANGDVWKLNNYIAWIQVEDYEGHNFQYNITLLNPNYTVNQSIVSNYATTNPIYNWNTTTVPDGIYSIQVKVFENETTEGLSNENTLSGNFTINNKGPKVFDLVPANGTIFTSGSTVLIGANVTDIVGVDTVLVNITLPDNTIQQKELNFTSVNWYNTTFNDTLQDGQYKALIIANDTYGLVNDTEFTFFVVPNDAPNITINGPANGTNYTKNVFNITLNATVEDINNDSLCVKVYASNTTPINENLSLLSRQGACYQNTIEEVTYNWTAPVIQPDANTVMLLHFDNIAELGENTTHMYDYSGTGNNGSCSAGTCPTYTSGKIGAAEEFTTGDYVVVQDSATLDGMSELSIEAWINVTDIDEYQIVEKNQTYELYTDTSGNVHFQIYGPDVEVVSTSKVDIGEWHLIQATYNGSEMRIYFDGVLENTASRSGAVPTTSGDVYIGISAATTNGFDGIIDQVVIKNASLGTAEQRDHYRLHNGTWYWYVHADDGLESSSSGAYHINVKSNIKPTIDQVILNSTDGTNYTDENLTRYVINATDADNGRVKNITNWDLNGTSFAALNMPFEAKSWNETAQTKDYANGNDGKVYDAEWLRTGGYDGFGTYKFTGQEWINITHSATLNISNEITMEAWVYPTSFVSAGIIFAKPHTSFSNPYVIYGLGYASSNNRYDIAIADGSTQRNCPTTINTVNTNTWQHVVATFNGSTAKVYIDGQENSSCDFTPFNISTNSEPLFLGYYPFGNDAYNYEGLLDEVRIYSRALSAQQVLELYNNGAETIVSQETAIGDTWQACVTPNDNREDGTEMCSNNLTITFPNTPPNTTQPVITPQLPTNNSDLVCSATITDAELTSLYAYFTWYRNNVSYWSGQYADIEQNDFVGNCTESFVGTATDLLSSGDFYAYSLNTLYNCTNKPELHYFSANGAYGTRNYSNVNLTNSQITVDIESYVQSSVTNATFYVQVSNDNATWTQCGLPYLHNGGGTYYKTWTRTCTGFTGTDLYVKVNSTRSGINLRVGLSNFNITTSDPVIINNTLTNISTLTANNTQTGEEWICEVTPYDGYLNGTARNSTAVTINTKPHIDQVILNSTYGTNYTDENLTRYIINLTDAEGNRIKNITEWFLNGTVIQRLILPFEATGGNESTWTKDYIEPSGRNLTITGATWNRTGGHDGFGAYEYGGDGDKITNNCTANGATEITVTVWVKSDVTNTDNGIWIGREPDGTDSVCGLRYDASGFVGGGTNLIKSGFSINNGTATVELNYESANNTQTTGWQFIAVTWRTGEPIEMYINGVKDVPTYQESAVNGSITGVTGLRVGIGAKDTGATGWDGYIDDMEIYTRKLSEKQIVSLYTKTDRILSNETRVGDEWQACVTPNDNIEDGNRVCSNNLTIRNRKPTIDAVILNSTLGTNLTTENLTRYIINETDPDGDRVKNITNWYINNKSITVLNMPFEANNGNENVSTKDYSNYQNGTVVSAMWGKTGGYDGWGAYHFDTNSQYIQVPENDRYDIFNDTKMTIMFWYKYDTTASQSMVAKAPGGLGSNGYGWDVRLSVSDAPVFFYNNGSGSISSLSSGINTNFGNWYHVAVTVDRETEIARIYLNGTEAANKTLDRPGTWNNALDLNVGARANGVADFNGTIDEVRIFNRTLSAQQILAYYNNRTDLIVSQETLPAETWQACVTPNDNIEDGNKVCSNNLTIISVPIITPLGTGNTYLLNETALLQANITTYSTLTQHYATVTFPNGTQKQYNLTASPAPYYYENFTELLLRGRYNITYYAENNYGYNDTEDSYFTRIAYDIIDIVDMNYSFQNYTTTVEVNTSNILGLNITINHNKIKSIQIDNHDYSHWNSILMLDTRNPYNGTSFSIFGANSDRLNYTTMTVWANSSGDNTLYKCLNWSMQNRSCLDGNWTLVKNVNIGELYNFTMQPGDPGFLETSAAVDVALAPIANESFLLAFIDQAANNLSFQIINTNGSIIVNTTIVDGTVDGNSKVSVAAINSTHFAIAWTDGPSTALRAAIYNFSGALKVGPATLDANIGLNTDVSVAETGDNIIVCNANDADNDADYRIFFNNGTTTVGESNVDANMNPQAPLQNLLECTGINSTSWAYFWYRAGFFFFFDQARHETLNTTGGTLTGPTNIDTNILANFQVATTTLDNDKYALAWYDGSDQDITFAIVWANNGSNKVGPTDIDTAVGTDVRLATATVRQNDTSSDDLFVVAYWDDVDDDIKATVRDNSGNVFTAPFVVESQPNTTFRLLDVTARDPITGNTICPGYFVVAYTNSSGAGVFKGFNINGSAWNGVCGRADLVPLNISFSNNNPDENENVTIYSTILNNGTATANNFIVQFKDGTCKNGTQIDGNITINQLKGGKKVTINTTWIAFPVGPHNISVCVDVTDKVPESNETNNNLTVPLNVKAYNDYYGTLGGNVTLDKPTNETEYDWNATDAGNIYFVNANYTIDFWALQSLGRNISGGVSTNDFADADTNLNMTGFNDSIQVLWAVNASSPKQVINFTVRGVLIQNVPYINSTNNSNFITGILWDTSYDTNGQYDTGDNEPLIFIGNLNRNATGKFGQYDYEVHVPVLLRVFNLSVETQLQYFVELR